MVLPLDQGLEHGPTDFFPNPPALDTSYQVRLALEGGYSAIALGIGLAEKYMHEHAGEVPLILKLNGKTNIADDAEATSPAFATVEDAVRLGADAVGYTVYVGSPRQETEIREYGKVRAAVRAARHAARGVGLPARPRHRGEGRQGQPVRAGLRGARRRGARRRRGEAARADARAGREPGAVPLAARGRRGAPAPRRALAPAA